VQTVQSRAEPGRPDAAEIERKYLIRELPSLKGVKGEAVLQGYLALDADGAEVRLRHIGEKYLETVKTGSGLRRGEFETAISKDQFDTLWPATEGKRLEKTRYELDYEQHSIYLDVYHGKLDGLKVAEVEFESEGDSHSFNPPPWFGKEITEEASYKNRSLATKGLPKSQG